jgi:hypothetical protein
MAKLEVRKEFWDSLTKETQSHYTARYTITFKDEGAVNGK